MNVSTRRTCGKYLALRKILNLIDDAYEVEIQGAIDMTPAEQKEVASLDG